MKVEKVNQTTGMAEIIDLDVEEVTLLTVSEAESMNKKPIEANWWLRSPGCNNSYAAFVFSLGSVHAAGFFVDIELGVRPALKIRNMDLLKLEVGDVVVFAEKKWTVINDTTILCDDIIGRSCFRNDWQATDANDYEVSDIKKFLDDWKENGCRKEN